MVTLEILVEITRNQGFAKILIKKIEEFLKENEGEGITLTFKKELDSLYENLGL